MPNDDSFYERIAKQCNAEQIRDFLRPFKEVSKESKKEITVSSGKDDLIAVLKRGVAKSYFTLDAVINMLRECEENGQQHVFYFRPKSRSIRALCRDFGAIMARLHGDEWDEEYPIFEFRHDSYHWVDFRCGLNGKPRDWIAKAYGHERYFERIEVARPTPDRRIETFAAQSVNVVCLARWNDDDLFEIRVDSQRLDSVKAREERLKQVWNLLANALSEDDFERWDLKDARSFMAKNRRGHEDFELGDLRLLDSDGGVATFKPNTEAESVDDLPARTEAVNALAKVSDCDVLSIHWKIASNQSDGDPFTLTTICGGRFTHELIVRARTSSKAIDHVTNKLRQFDATTA